MSKGKSSNVPCVYILYFDFGNPYVKVGVSKNLGRRLVSLATPERPSSVSFLRCESIEQAQAIEAALLRYMQEHRRNGEWFSGRPGEFAHIIRTLMLLIDSLAVAWGVPTQFERYVQSALTDE